MTASRDSRRKGIYVLAETCLATHAVNAGLAKCIQKTDARAWTGGRSDWIGNQSAPNRVQDRHHHPRTRGAVMLKRGLPGRAPGPDRPSVNVTRCLRESEGKIKQAVNELGRTYVFPRSPLVVSGAESVGCTQMRVLLGSMDCHDRQGNQAKNLMFKKVKT